MTKKQFLEALNDRLNVLESRERADLLAEYETHIDMKMDEGLSEEAAIAAFGDFDELVKEILSAYHVDPHYRQEDATLSATIRKIGRFFQASIDSLLNMNKQEGFYVLGRMVMMAVVVMVVILGVSLLKHILLGFVGGLFGSGFFGIRNVFSSFLELVFGLIGFFIVCYAVYFFFNRYVIASDAWKNDVREDYDTNAQTERKPSDLAVKKMSVHKKQKSEPGDERLAKAFYLVVKILVVFAFFIPAVSSAVSLFAGFGVLIVMLLMGWPLIGLTLITLGAFLILLALINFVWGLTFQREAE